jgi:hypothetical protein
MKKLTACIPVLVLIYVVGTVAYYGLNIAEANPGKTKAFIQAFTR